MHNDGPLSACVSVQAGTSGAGIPQVSRVVVRHHSDAGWDQARVHQPQAAHAPLSKVAPHARHPCGCEVRQERGHGVTTDDTNLSVLPRTAKTTHLTLSLFHQRQSSTSNVFYIIIQQAHLLPIALLHPKLAFTSFPAFRPASTEPYVYLAPRNPSTATQGRRFQQNNTLVLTINKSLWPTPLPPTVAVFLRPPKPVWYALAPFSTPFARYRVMVANMVENSFFLSLIELIRPATVRKLT